MWETIELRELRVFLVLAEELHFGRTAERLGLTQSRVSQSLRALEHKLGGQLVYRTSRRVSLTASGERFRAEASAAYDQLTGVLARTHAANRGLRGTLRLGQFTGPSAGPHLLGIVAAFEARYPDCHVELDQLAQDDMLEQLRRGQVDLITTWLPIEQPDVVIGPILNREPRVLAVGRDHPLAGRGGVSIEDIADYRVPRFEQLPRELQEAWMPSRTPSGRPIPHVNLRMPTDLAVLTYRIARGDLVHATVPSAAPTLGAGIVYVPITDMPPWRGALAWRRRASDPRLREFIRTARDVLADARRLRA